MPFFNPIPLAYARELGRVCHHTRRWIFLGSATVLIAKAAGVTADTTMPDLLDTIISAAYSPVSLLGTLVMPVAMATVKVVPYAVLNHLSRHYGLAVASTIRRRLQPSVEDTLSEMADGFYGVLNLMIAAYLGLWMFAPHPSLLILASACAALLGVMAYAFAQEPAPPAPLASTS